MPTVASGGLVSAASYSGSQPLSPGSFGSAPRNCVPGAAATTNNNASLPSAYFNSSTRNLTIPHVTITLPGGTYLRTRLQGEPPAIHERIPSTWEKLVKQAAFDGSRPTIEFYRSRDVIDLLLPVM